MNDPTNTIIAIATPLGQGGIGIIRISGNLVPKISHVLLKKLPYPRQATYSPLYDSTNTNILDYVIALFFPKPNSFTGEHILEIHGHGGIIILETIIQNILQISKKHIRIAEPGEFTERAFINNKIDLTQAEAISDLINANSYQAAQLASQTLQGIFSKKIKKIEKQLSNLRVYIESKINFPEEKIETLNFNEIKQQIKKIINNTTQLYKNAQDNITIQEGIKIVITGKPNSGKSSLFNILSGEEIAIVTPISGTTRDTLHKHIQLDGILTHIIDTAGLQEYNNIDNPKKTINTIEKIGIKRAWNEIKRAHHILLLIDSQTTSMIECYKLQSKIKQQTKNNTPITIIKNKADLTKEKIKITHTNEQTIITISAKYNQGIDLITQNLKQHLKNNIKMLNNNKNEQFSTRQRHIETLKLICQHMLQANKILKKYIKYRNPQENEILAEEIKYAHEALHTITGQLNSNDLLKKIFSTFCIGK